MIGTDFLPTEGLTDISGVFDKQKLVETMENCPRHPDSFPRFPISIPPMYTSTTFIYIRSGEQEFLILTAHVPISPVWKTGKLYPIEDAADILEAISPQQVYSSDDESIYGGGGASPESPVSLADGNKYFAGRRRHCPNRVANRRCDFYCLRSGSVQNDKQMQNSPCLFPYKTAEAFFLKLWKRRRLLYRIKNLTFPRPKSP